MVVPLCTCHLSSVSFQINCESVESPLSTRNPALAEGVPVTFLFNVISLSSTDNVAVFNVVAAPETTKSPVTVTVEELSPNVTSPPDVFNFNSATASPARA